MGAIRMAVVLRVVWGTFDQLQLAKAQVSCKCTEAHTTVCLPSSATMSQRALIKQQRVLLLEADLNPGVTSTTHNRSPPSAAPCLLLLGVVQVPARRGVGGSRCVSPETTAFLLTTARPLALLPVSLQASFKSQRVVVLEADLSVTRSGLDRANAELLSAGNERARLAVELRAAEKVRGARGMGGKGCG